jgi:hypothetical protein
MIMELVNFTTLPRDLWRDFVNTVMNLWVPQNAGEVLGNCTTGGFSRRAKLHGVSYLAINNFLWIYYPSFQPLCYNTILPFRHRF